MAAQAKRSEEELQRLREKKEVAFKTHQELLQQVEEDADRQARTKPSTVLKASRHHNHTTLLL